MFFKDRSKYNWKEVFLKYGSRLASLAHHGEVYKTLLRTLLEVSGAEASSIVLFDPALNQCSLKEYLGPSPLQFTLSAQHPVILWLRRDARPLTKHRLVEDPRMM